MLEKLSTYKLRRVVMVFKLFSFCVTGSLLEKYYLTFQIPIFSEKPKIMFVFSWSCLKSDIFTNCGWLKCFINIITSVIIIIIIIIPLFVTISTGKIEELDFS